MRTRSGQTDGRANLTERSASRRAMSSERTPQKCVRSQARARSFVMPSAVIRRQRPEHKQSGKVFRISTLVELFGSLVWLSPPPPPPPPTEVMFGVLIIVLRPDCIADLGFSPRERQVSLIVPLGILRVFRFRTARTGCPLARYSKCGYCPSGFVRNHDCLSAKCYVTEFYSLAAIGLRAARAHMPVGGRASARDRVVRDGARLGLFSPKA